MPALTFLHVVISLIGIVSGIVVAFEMIANKSVALCTFVFLLSTIATSATGFLFFPFQKLLPSHVVGILSLVVLAVACFARYIRRLNGSWRWIYIVTVMLAFYLNFFVLIVQAFLKVPALKALAPKQTEPPFVHTQLVTLGVFVVLTIIAVIRFRPARSA